MLKTNCIYCRYFVVGAIVSVTAIVAREIIGFMLPSDTQIYYVLSVLIVYAGGIIMSFAGHYRVTFSHIRQKQKLMTSIFSFTLIAFVGMIVTALLSYVIRYNLDLGFIPGKYSAAISFGIATVVASLITYTLNARYTFAESVDSVLQGE